MADKPTDVRFDDTQRELTAVSWLLFSRHSAPLGKEGFEVISL